MKKKTRTGAAPLKEQSWKPLLRVLRGNVPWPWYVVNLLASMLVGSLFVRLPELTGRIMAGEIYDSALVVEFVLLTAANAATSALYTCSVNWAGYMTERNIQRSLWGKLIHMPMFRYDRQHPSSLISRVTTDTTMATSFLSNVLMLFYLIFVLVMVFLQIFGKNSSIGFAVLLVVPYVLAVAVIPGRMRFRATARRQRTLADFTTFVAERLSNITLVKSYAAENADLQLGYAVAEENYKADVKLAIVDCAAQPFAYLSEIIISCIVLIMGGTLVSQGALDQGSLISLYMYGSNIYAFLLMTVTTFYQFKDVHGSTQAIGEIMVSAPEQVQREKSFTQPDADILFDHVSFGYTEEKVIDDVSLLIPQGKVTAIVGPSGAGKTTLLSLLERLYVPAEGQLKFGTTPVESIHLNEWRSASGYIQQNSPLLSGTIRDNITYGLDREATDEELIHAAKLANAYDFISKLPDGFDTGIGAMGGKLSGGERQRIAIARMIIKDPDLLLLDEATSNLDAENEAQIQSSLNSIMQGRTAVIVAHNLRTVVGADNIVVMDQGRVQAVGTHEALYAGNALYRKYIDLQFSKGA